MARDKLYRLLISMNNIRNTHLKTLQGVYPPNIDLNPNQTNKKMYNQIKTFSKYLEFPEYSYLSKNKR